METIRGSIVSSPHNFKTGRRSGIGKHGTHTREHHVKLAQAYGYTLRRGIAVSTVLGIKKRGWKLKSSRTRKHHVKHGHPVILSVQRNMSNRTLNIQLYIAVGERSRAESAAWPTNSSFRNHRGKTHAYAHTNSYTHAHAHTRLKACSQRALQIVYLHSHKKQLLVDFCGPTTCSSVGTHQANSNEKYTNSTNVNSRVLHTPATSTHTTNSSRLTSAAQPPAAALQVTSPPLWTKSFSRNQSMTSGADQPSLYACVFMISSCGKHEVTDISCSQSVHDFRRRPAFAACLRIHYFIMWKARSFRSLLQPVSP